jgi:hypothetical protein
VPRLPVSQLLVDLGLGFLGGGQESGRLARCVPPAAYRPLRLSRGLWEGSVATLYACCLWRRYEVESRGEPCSRQNAPGTSRRRAPSPPDPHRAAACTPGAVSKRTVACDGRSTQFGRMQSFRMLMPPVPPRPGWPKNHHRVPHALAEQAVHRSLEWVGLAAPAPGRLPGGACPAPSAGHKLARCSQDIYIGVDPRVVLISLVHPAIPPL